MSKPRGLKSNVRTIVEKVVLWAGGGSLLNK